MYLYMYNIVQNYVLLNHSRQSVNAVPTPVQTTKTLIKYIKYSDAD